MMQEHLFKQRRHFPAFGQLELVARESQLYVQHSLYLLSVPHLYIRAMLLCMILRVRHYSCKVLKGH